MARPSPLLCVPALCVPALGAAALGAAACASPPALERGPDLGALFLAAPPRSAAPEPPRSASGAPAPAPAAATAPCSTDDDCGYDPIHRQCGADPRYNKQPPIVDQGLICYCEAGACALLRVEPAPCEGETSCAIHLDPRPHPVHIDAAHPYQKPRLCLPPRRGQRSASELIATCERTNICTMSRRECARP